MARWMLLVFGILGITWNVECRETNKYDNYTLIRLFPTNEDHLKALRNFENDSQQVEILKEMRGLNTSFDVLVPPDNLGFVENFAKKNHMPLEVKRRNYGRSFEDPSVPLPTRRMLGDNLVFRYNSFAEIQKYLEALKEKHPSLVTLEAVGNSYEGRAMTLIKISNNPKARNPVIFIDAGIHAREWVAPALAVYIISRLTQDDARQKELNNVDWYILPVVNPDGYEYSRTSYDNRMWRKTRSTTNGVCFGVDANRNYAFKWAVSGVSHDPCNAETYAGPKPFSEPETRIVRNIMMNNQDRLKLYVSLHSYGQYLVYPWGYTGNYLPKTWKKLDSLARKVSLAVTRAGGKPFNVLSAGQWYPAAGASDDFAFGAFAVPYSYTMELTDGHEFIFPEKLLNVVLPQFYEGFKVFGSQIRREFRHR